MSEVPQEARDMISALQADSYEDACEKMGMLTTELERIRPENGGTERLGPVLKNSSLRPQYANSLEEYFRDSSRVGTDTEALLSDYRLNWNTQAYDPKVIDAQVARLEEEQRDLVDRARDLGKCVFGRERSVYRQFWWGDSIGIDQDCASNLGRFLRDISGLDLEKINWVSFVEVVKKLASEGLAVIAATPALTIILYLLRLYANVLGRAIEGANSANGVWLQRTYISPWIWVKRR